MVGVAASCGGLHATMQSSASGTLELGPALVSPLTTSHLLGTMAGVQIDLHS